MRLMMVALALLCAPAAAQKPEGIEFDLDVLPAVARHLELLAFPAYLALALENNGVRPSLSSPLVIRNRETVQVKTGIVRYTGRKGSVFNYEAGVNLSLGIAESTLTMRTEIDTSKAGQGIVLVRVFPPLAKLIPEQLIEKVDFKIRAFGSIETQEKVLAYLDRIAKEQQGRGRGADGMLEAIAFDAYNRSASAERSDAARQLGKEPEPIYGRKLLLAALVLWIAGFPVFLYLIRRRRGEGRAST
jgi:hypothetical protein